ncbi:YraN family protein [Patescibacteria group bacterium]|nr:YraN family protein [Patescibacteria group bacterium]MBU1730618.1 YraN family protein [Patescibacteria group bacterium]MBU1956399.1 YraN family protein [Patescibacteria group bacterium]
MVITHKKHIGDLGEEIACRFLERKGFAIKDRNYRKKYGEIDIIAVKDKELHFVEVKSVSRQKNIFQKDQNEYAPEDNVHPWKLKRLSRTIESYLLDSKKCPQNEEEPDWQFDIIVVLLYKDEKHAEIKFLQNIMLE